jgi:hypothetical protein
MTIILARLQERNAQKGWMCRDYTSTRGTTYRAGEDGVPSPLTVVRDEIEARELSEFSPQFEFVEADDEKHLAEIIQYEMEMRVRAGRAPVRAEVLGATLPTLEAPRPAVRSRTAVFPDAAPQAAAVPATTAAVPAPRIARNEPRATVDDDGDLSFPPAPIPKAPAGVPDEGASPAPEAVQRRGGGRRGRG